MRGFRTVYSAMEYNPNTRFLSLPFEPRVWYCYLTNAKLNTTFSTEWLSFDLFNSEQLTKKLRYAFFLLHLQQDNIAILQFRHFTKNIWYFLTIFYDWPSRLYDTCWHRELSLHDLVVYYCDLGHKYFVQRNQNVQCIEPWYYEFCYECL